MLRGFEWLRGREASASGSRSSTYAGDATATRRHRRPTIGAPPALAEASKHPRQFATPQLSQHSSPTVVSRPDRAFTSSPNAPRTWRPNASEALNVMLILIDDLRPDIHAFGANWAHTPNMDALSRRGVSFAEAHASVANCAPSRAALLTGRRPDWNGVMDLYTGVRQHDSGVVTLPQHFKKHGYVTARFGKVYHQALDDDQSWSSAAQFPCVNVRCEMGFGGTCGRPIARRRRYAAGGQYAEEGQSGGDGGERMSDSEWDRPCANPWRYRDYALHHPGRKQPLFEKDQNPKNANGSLYVDAYIASQAPFPPRCRTPFPPYVRNEFFFSLVRGRLYCVAGNPLTHPHPLHCPPCIPPSLPLPPPQNTSLTPALPPPQTPPPLPPPSRPTGSRCSRTSRSAVKAVVPCRWLCAPTPAVERACPLLGCDRDRAAPSKGTTPWRLGTQPRTALRGRS